MEREDGQLRFTFKFQGRPTIQERFEEFDALNPHVYDLFKRLAHKARKAGHKRFSADMILHRIRWHHLVTIRRPDRDKDLNDTFKLNDHFSSRYARKLIEEDKSFKGFFATRALKTA